MILNNIKINKLFIADLSLLIVAMIWGGGFVVTKNILNYMSPFYFLGIRFVSAALIIAIIFNKKLKKINYLTFKKGIIIGIFLFLGFATQTVGLIYTTPAKQSFITGINVVIVPFLYMLVTGNRVEKKAIIGAVLASLGLSLISFQKGVFNFNFGDLLTLTCAFFYAAHIVSIGILVKKADPINLTIVQLAFTGFVSLLIGIFTEPFSVDSIQFSSLIYMIILGGVAAFLIQNVAQYYTFSTHAAIILSLESVFGAFFSWIFWDENISKFFIIGAILILTGIIITEYRTERRKIADNHD